MVKEIGDKKSCKECNSILRILLKKFKIQVSMDNCKSCPYLSYKISK